MAMTEADVVRHFVDEGSMCQIGDVCGSGEIWSYAALGHLPRLAALKAFARALSWHGDEPMRWRYETPPVPRHIWVRFVATGDEDSRWMMLPKPAGEDTDLVPVTVIDL